MQSFPRERLCVTIVSDNAETLDGLATYLRRAGVATNGTRHIQRLSQLTPLSSSAVVLFPDDFNPTEVMAALLVLRTERPTTLPVLVTKEPKRFAQLPASNDRAAPLVVPKPIWGWTILDAIRARLDLNAADGKS